MSREAGPSLLQAAVKAFQEFSLRGLMVQGFLLVTLCVRVLMSQNWR